MKSRAHPKYMAKYRVGNWVAGTLAAQALWFTPFDRMLRFVPSRVTGVLLV